MTTTEAINALKLNLNLNITDNDIVIYSSSKVNTITENFEIDCLSIHYDNAEIEVGFSTILPVDTVNPMRVSWVQYWMPNTPENIENMIKNSFKKYGLPTVDGTKYSSSGYHWCDSISYSYAVCKDDAPILSLIPPELYMEDGKYDKAIKDYIDNKNSSAQTF